MRVTISLFVAATARVGAQDCTSPALGVQAFPASGCTATVVANPRFLLQDGFTASVLASDDDRRSWFLTTGNVITPNTPTYWASVVLTRSSPPLSLTDLCSLPAFDNSTVVSTPLAIPVSPECDVTPRRSAAGFAVAGMGVVFAFLVLTTGCSVLIV